MDISQSRADSGDKTKNKFMAAILIIDDQSIARQLLSILVGPISNGHEVMAFDCAQEALNWAQNNPIALVVTDYRMPEMNGIEFIRQFRGYPTGARVPVIMMSGDDDQNLRAEAMAAGATDFMLKPINHQECRERCRMLLEDTRYSGAG